MTYNPLGSQRGKDREAKALAEGRNPRLKGRPPRVSKEEKAAKRRAKEARYRANPEWKAKKYAAKNSARRAAYAAKSVADGKPVRKWRYTKEERAISDREKVKKWQRANKDYVAVNSRNRRARVKNAEGSHTTADIKALFFEQKGLCGLCDMKLDAENFHVDHWKPLARGGSNDKSNLKLLHPRCNLMKSSKDPLELITINVRSN